MSKRYKNNIKPLAGGRYEVRVAERDPDGRKHERRRIVEGKRRDAVDEAERQRAELHAELYPAEASPVMTLGAYAALWLKRRVPRLKPSTTAKYINDLERHILPVLGETRLDELRPSHVQAMLDADRGAPMSRRNRLRLLATMAKDALVDELIRIDWTLRVTVRVDDAYTEDQPNCLTDEELGRLLDAIPEYWLDLVTVLAFTGLRFGEVSALHWDAIDLERGTLKVVHTNWKGTLLPPKTRKGRRTVALDDDVIAILRNRRQRMIAKRQPGLARGLVFPTQDGELHKGTPLRPVLQRASERAGIDSRLTTHGLRRTFNDLARRYVKGVVLRSVLGHSDERMTDHYSNVGLEEKRAVSTAVVKAVRSKEKRRDQAKPALAADLAADSASTPSAEDEKDE